MTDRTIDLDVHRGMAAQKATELRRLLVGVQADQAALKARQDALEEMLAALPAAGWPEAVEKARYLLTRLEQCLRAWMSCTFVFVELLPAIRIRRAECSATR